MSLHVFQSLTKSETPQQRIHFNKVLSKNTYCLVLRSNVYIAYEVAKQTQHIKLKNTHSDEFLTKITFPTKIQVDFIYGLIKCKEIKSKTPSPFPAALANANDIYIGVLNPDGRIK